MAPDPVPPAERIPSAASIREDFRVLEETRPPGLTRRLLTTYRHLLGLLFGGLAAHLRDRPAKRRRGALYYLARALNGVTRHFVKSSLVRLPFPAQLRRRMEMLGPTYIKLGQILSLRRDLLPPAITAELKTLLDRLPAVPYRRFVELVAEDLGRDPHEIFSYIESRPLGSASIAQAHRAGTRDGHAVILKVVKPGIREILQRDAALLRTLGSLLQRLLPRYQPKRIIDEFCYYTLREVDLRLEADNAESFAANFADDSDIVFPRIYRQYSGDNVLCMEYLRGVKPNSLKALRLSAADRDRIIDLGASAIIRMLYEHGFFHADLHPANLLILPGPKCGFIDLGMAGRFDGDLRRRLLYYYYCLVMGDAENAARHLSALARPGSRGDPHGFRREVEDICRRWQRNTDFEAMSLGQLILESVGKGARYRMYFPVEMVLMVKAIVTFEAVGHILKPGFDVAAVSRRHINRIFLHQFSPVRLLRETLRGAPELVDALVKAPRLITEGVRFLERSAEARPENPSAGMRGAVLGASCLVSGAILAASGGPPALWIGLFVLAGLLVLSRGRI